MQPAHTGLRTRLPPQKRVAARESGPSSLPCSYRTSLAVSISAPGRIRTCDPLLRRQRRSPPEPARGERFYARPLALDPVVDPALADRKEPTERLVLGYGWSERGKVQGR